MLIRRLSHKVIFHSIRKLNLFQIIVIYSHATLDDESKRIIFRRKMSLKGSFSSIDCKYPSIEMWPTKEIVISSDVTPGNFMEIECQGENLYLKIKVTTFKHCYGGARIKWKHSLQLKKFKSFVFSKFNTQQICPIDRKSDKKYVWK